MPEIRRDLLTQRHVIFAPERALRPHELSSSVPDELQGDCPFCEGEEAATPGEVFAIREADAPADQPGWSVRVVPNRFPALQTAGELAARPEGIFDLSNGIGAHEVIIECPQHETRLENLEVSQIDDVLRAWQQRITDLAQDQRLEYVQIFKNSGAGAGATLPHCHSQLIATPYVPQVITEKLQGAWRYYDLRQRCVFCDWIYQELQDTRRVIRTTSGFVALSPYAARQAFETVLLPRNHAAADFCELSSEQRTEFAELLRNVLQRQTVVLGKVPFNLLLHTSPLRELATPTFHWHVEIIPRTSQLAGFEWSTGGFINTVLPEEAARLLRAAST